MRARGHVTWEDDMRSVIVATVAASPSCRAACSRSPRRTDQRRPSTRQGGGAQQQPPPTETEAPDIPGVAKAGTKVQVIKFGFQGTEGPIGMPDGTVIFTETQANRITRIAAGRDDVDLPREHQRREWPGIRCQGTTARGADHARADQDRRRFIPKAARRSSTTASKGSRTAGRTISL